MDISVVGAGRVGTALAVLLSRAGHRVVGVSGGSRTAERATKYLPGVPVGPPAWVAADAEVVVIATPDDRIALICSDLANQEAFRADQTVIHLSGATGLDALSRARDTGAAVLSLHPLQTFPDVEGAIDRVPGSGMAVTAENEDGYQLGERLAEDVGARPFRLTDEAKPLYHAAAVFASNYVVAVVGVAERLFHRAGIREPLPLFLPLFQATADAIAAQGPAEALTGPAVRGDAGTVEANVTALRRRARYALPAYLALAESALDLAERARRISPSGRLAVQEVLDRWK
jgi:predicted short-subunit dehydrogenase-like oxidoreductase (DUF2520 family)